MELIKEYIYTALIASITAGIATMLTRSDNGMDKYVKFTLSIVILSVIATPILSSLKGIYESCESLSEINFSSNSGINDINSSKDAYIKSVELACENLIYDKFSKHIDVTVTAKLKDDGELKIERIQLSGDVSREMTAYIKSLFLCEVIGFKSSG